jgi:xylose isomerase
MTKSIFNGIDTTEFKDDGDQLIIKKSQDIGAIIEANKADYNETDAKTRWSENQLGNRVARIPLVVFQELEKQGITRGFAVIDMPRFKAWLNNSDNQVFRTRVGKI